MLTTKNQLVVAYKLVLTVLRFLRNEKPCNFCDVLIYLDMHCAGIGNGTENAQSNILEIQFFLTKIHFLKHVVHSLFVVTSVFPKILNLCLLH